MLNAPSTQIETDKIKSDLVMAKAESFLDKNLDMSKLNGNRNAVVQEVVDILVRLEDTVRESGNELNESEMGRIIQLLERFEEYQVFSADITHCLLNLTSLIDAQRNRLKEKKILETQGRCTPKDIHVVAMGVKSRMDKVCIDEGICFDMSNLFQLVLNYTNDNSLMDLDEGQKDYMRQILDIIKSLLHSPEFHQLAATETGIGLEIESKIFRIKMDLLIKGEWGYLMSR